MSSRGYDSAGIGIDAAPSFLEAEEKSAAIDVVKRAGKVEVLKQEICTMGHNEKGVYFRCALDDILYVY